MKKKYVIIKLKVRSSRCENVYMLIVLSALNDIKLGEIV